jgi:DNA modification methylase
MEIKTEHLGQVPIALIKIIDRYRYDKGEIELMAASLAEHGQVQPVVVNSKMRLLAGERRILGALSLGWENIRAEMRTGDTSISELEVELVENEIRKNFIWPEVARLEKTIFDMRCAKDPKWSQRKQAEMRDSAQSAVNMRLQLAEAIELLPELAECETQDEAWKQYKRLEEVITIGQLKTEISDDVRNAPQWAHQHYIVGDALAEMPLISDNLAHFAEVDPPYGIEIDRRKGRNEGEGFMGDYNEIDAKRFPPFMKAVIGETFRILKPNSFAVFWYGMQWHCEMLKWLDAAGFAVNPMPAMWYKGNSGQTAQPDVALASCYEPFLLARKGQPKMLRQGRGNVFHYAPIPPSRKIHPTEKPIELLSDILNTILFPGSTVLIPFLGSGVTLRAAYKAGHTGFGFDLSEANKTRFVEAVGREFASTEDDGNGADSDA